MRWTRQHSWNDIQNEIKWATQKNENPQLWFNLLLELFWNLHRIFLHSNISYSKINRLKENKKLYVDESNFILQTNLWFILILLKSFALKKIQTVIALYHSIYSSLRIWLHNRSFLVFTTKYSRINHFFNWNKFEPMSNLFIYQFCTTL